MFEYVEKGRRKMICRWGILGLGFVATRAVIPALQDVADATLLAVASTDPERGRSCAASFGIERVYSNYQALLDDPEIDAVYLALPNHLHHQWTIRAAQAGKHVLCEKPLAITVRECDEMIAACQQAGVYLMEAVMYRFHPRMLSLKKTVAEGELGEIRFLHAAFSFFLNAPGNYRTFPEYGGGALLDVGSYCVNAACWLLGAEPTAIHAYTSYSHELGIDVSTSALLQFEQERVAHLQCSFVAGEHQVIEVVGSSGAITAPLAFTAWRDDVTTLHIQKGSVFEERKFAPADPYREMVAHFTDCVLGRTAPLYPPQDGRATIRVLEQIRQASI